MTSIEKKTAAKVGMTASLGSLIVTALNKGKLFRQFHLASGIALIAFSVWHYSLYQKKKKETASVQSQKNSD